MKTRVRTYSKKSNPLEQDVSYQVLGSWLYTILVVGLIVFWLALFAEIMSHMSNLSDLNKYMLVVFIVLWTMFLYFNKIHWFTIKEIKNKDLYLTKVQKHKINNINLLNQHNYFESGIIKDSYSLWKQKQRTKLFWESACFLLCLSIFCWWIMYFINMAFWKGFWWSFVIFWMLLFIKHLWKKSWMKEQNKEKIYTLKLYPENFTRIKDELFFY